MTELLLVVLIVLLQYISSAFAASIPSPLLLPLHQSPNSTVAFNASLAAASNSSLIPSSNNLPPDPWQRVQDCEQRLLLKFSDYERPLDMRDFAAAYRLARHEAGQHLGTEVMPAGLWVYHVEPHPLAAIVIESSAQTTWGNFRCTIAGIRRFMQRWEYVELEFEAETIDGGVRKVTAGIVTGRPQTTVGANEG